MGYWQKHSIQRIDSMAAISTCNQEETVKQNSSASQLLKRDSKLTYTVSEHINMATDTTGITILKLRLHQSLSFYKQSSKWRLTDCCFYNLFQVFFGKTGQYNKHILMTIFPYKPALASFSYFASPLAPMLGIHLRETKQKTKGNNCKGVNDDKLGCTRAWTCRTRQDLHLSISSISDRCPSCHHQ